MSSTLIALTSKAIELEQEIIASEGELTPELEDALKISKENIKEKVDGYAYLLSRIDQSIEYHEAMIKDHKTIIDRLGKHKDYLLGNLLGASETLGLGEMNGSEHVVKIKQNPPSVSITDEAIISDEFKVVKTVTSVDKKKIKEGLSLGVEIPGARLTQSKRVEIKTRVDLLKDKK